MKSLIVYITKYFFVTSIITSFILSFSISTYAQSCILACGNISIGLSGSCEIEVLPEQVSTELSESCTYSLTFVRMGNPAASPILTSLDIGEVIVYTLTASNGISCNGQISVFSDGGPSVFCPNEPITVSCGQDISAIPAPSAVSCNGLVSSVILEEREIQSADCSAMFYRIVEVDYEYSDESAETTICTVTYQVEATDIAEILPPSGVTLECAPALDISVGTLGVPTNNGESFIPSSSCNISMSGPVDNRSFGCGNTEIITRTWTLQDMCAVDPTDTEIISQIITIEDALDPTISLPEGPILASTSANDCLSGDILLPAANIFDLCSDIDQLTVQISNPLISIINTNGGTISGLPIGTHEILYRVTDDCGNSSSTTINIIVSDNVTPNPTCHDNRVVTLNNLGTAIIPAAIFDNGSTDNCGSVFFKARRMNPSDCDPSPVFDDAVGFCCSDVENPVTIVLRVYDVDPGAGPVGEDDFLVNSSDCTVTVIVQDKLTPTVACPSDVTVDCNFDLDFFLTNDIPTSSDNCGGSLSHSVDLNLSALNACGIGIAERTITYTDLANEIVCIQTIVVENSVVGGGISIDWPEKVMITGCGGSIEPEDLEEGFSRPIVTSEGCTRIGISHEDIVFDIVEDACFKVVRTWEVIDSCSFDLTTGAGRFVHHQLIKVLDDVDPEIIGLSDVNFIYSVDENCDVSDAFVEIPEISANDCTPSDRITFRYRIDYGNNGQYDTPFVLGNDASGIFPIGANLVQFRADDMCGNLTYGSFVVNVTVEDTTKPSPVLRNLSTALMPGMQMVTIPAELFNVESEDNCTSPEALTFSYSSDRDSTERVFTCDDLDTAFVTIYVWDEAGNSDFVEVFIAVSDNLNECFNNGSGTGTQAKVHGNIFNENEEEIASVRVSLLQSTMNPVETDQDGYFAFEGAQLNSTYEVAPSKSNDPRNGVNILDLIRIQRHILGIERLGSPYKMIAADANRNGNISGTDLLAILRVVLGYTNDFDGHDSWRFIDSEYQFNDPLNPLAERFSETYKINNLEGDESRDFVGVKIGDVDNSSRLSEGIISSTSRNRNDFSFEVEDRWLERGESVYVSVKAAGFKDVMGFQGTIQIDPSKAQYMGIIFGSLEGFGKENINTGLSQEGIIPIAWYNEQGQSLSDGEEVFSIKLYITDNTFLGDILSLNNTFIENIQQTTDRVGLLKMRFNHLQDFGRNIRLLQNKPNPFDSETILSFYLKEETEAMISVMDMTGKIIWKQQGIYGRGNTDVVISKNILGGPGIYLYRLDAPGFSDTKKMVLVSN